MHVQCNAYFTYSHIINSINHTYLIVLFLGIQNQNKKIDRYSFQICPFKFAVEIIYHIENSNRQHHQQCNNKPPLFFFNISLRNFLAYKWGMEAFMIAHDRMVNGRKDLLIVILKEKINVDRLPANLRVYIRKFTEKYPVHKFQ